MIELTDGNGLLTHNLTTYSIPFTGIKWWIVKHKTNYQTITLRQQSPINTLRKLCPSLRAH